MASDSTEKTEAPEAAPEAAQAQAQQPVQVRVDDTGISASYANFCRVTGSPEELIIDFGLNPQPMGPPKDPINVSQRVIVNFFTAKRLLAALQMAVQRHERVFGVLETDVNSASAQGSDNPRSRVVLSSWFLVLGSWFLADQKPPRGKPGGFFRSCG